MIYLMNSAVMPAGCYGHYLYQPASVGLLRWILEGENGPWVSCIGYPQTAAMIESWTGIHVAVNRHETRLIHGDAMVIVRLKYRVENPATKGAKVSDDPADWEIAHVKFFESMEKKP